MVRNHLPLHASNGQSSITSLTPKIQKIKAKLWASYSIWFHSLQWIHSKSPNCKKLQGHIFEKLVLDSAKAFISSWRIFFTKTLLSENTITRITLFDSNNSGKKSWNFKFLNTYSFSKLYHFLFIILCSFTWMLWKNGKMIYIQEKCTFLKYFTITAIVNIIVVCDSMGIFK